MSLQKLVKACALAAVISLAAGSVQAQTITLKLSHFVPPQHAFHKWVTAWAEKIEKESNGRLKSIPMASLLDLPIASSTRHAMASPIFHGACTA